MTGKGWECLEMAGHGHTNDDEHDNDDDDEADSNWMAVLTVPCDYKPQYYLGCMYNCPLPLPLFSLAGGSPDKRLTDRLRAKAGLPLI